MAQLLANNGDKKLIRVDISSDTVCFWCLIGKRNLDKAMDLLKDQFDFEVRWHPYFLNPSAPKEGLVKEDVYREKMGPRFESAIGRMTEVFRAHGLEYNLSGLTGNTMDSHRIMAFAGHQGLDKQHALAEELFLGYFTQAKYIGDRGFLIESAEKVGVQGAAEFLEDPDKGVQEANMDVQGSIKHILSMKEGCKCPTNACKKVIALETYADLEKYSRNITGVPYYVINGKHTLEGGQPPEVFLKSIQTAAEDSN